MTAFDEGQRVQTPHGPGVVAVKESCGADYVGSVRQISTGRRGVKLDVNPFAGIKDGVAYYWPKELSPG